MVPGERDWSIVAVQMAGMPATAAAFRASPGPRAAASPAPFSLCRHLPVTVARAAPSPGTSAPGPFAPRPLRGRTLGRSCRPLSLPTSPSRLGGAPKATRRHIAPRPRSKRLNCHCDCLSCFVCGAPRGGLAAAHVPSRPSTRDSANKQLEVPVILVVLIEYIHNV
jgi:hypothetical protein